MKKNIPVTIAGIEMEVYRLKRRADLLLTIIYFKSSGRMKLENREYLESILDLITDINAIPYLISEKKFPVSHFHVKETQMTYRAIRKLHNEIGHVFMILQKKISLFESQLWNDPNAFSRLKPGLNWERWVIRIREHADYFADYYSNYRLG